MTDNDFFCRTTVTFQNSSRKSELRFERTFIEKIGRKVAVTGEEERGVKGEREVKRRVEGREGGSRVVQTVYRDEMRPCHGQAGHVPVDMAARKNFATCV